MEIAIENKKGDRIEFSHTYPYCLLSFKPAPMTYSISSYSNISADGETYISSNTTKRNIELEFSLEASSELELLQMKNIVQKIISPASGKFAIEKTIKDTVFVIEATPTATTKWTDITPCAVKGRVVLVAHDPYWTKNKNSGGSINSWIPNTDFPLAFSGNNTENLLDGTDFTKDTAFALVNSGTATLTQDKTKGTLTCVNNAATKNGIKTTLVTGGLEKGMNYTFAVEGTMSCNSLNVTLECEDDSMYLEDGLSYGWNCTTKNEGFSCRNADGTPTGEGISIGTKLCVLWANFEKSLLEVQYLKNGIATNCWITNDPNCLEYRYKDKFKNTTGANLQLYYGDGTTTVGYLDPNEVCTVLYKYNGRYCVIYNSGSNVLAKTGTTTFNGAPGLLDENLGTIVIGQSTSTRAGITFQPQRKHEQCRLSVTNSVKSSTFTISKPKLETGTNMNPWNTSFNDNPEQGNGIELGYQDPARFKNFYNEGDSEIGILATFRFSGAVSNVVLNNTTTGKQIKLKGDFTSGDSIKIDTIEKEIKYINAEGIETDGYNYIDNYTNWDFGLIPGDNILQYDAQVGKELVEIYLEYKIKYMEV